MVWRGPNTPGEILAEPGSLAIVEDEVVALFFRCTLARGKKRGGRRISKRLIYEKEPCRF